jgi:hypothetical protein
MNKPKATAKQLTARPVTLPRRALTSAEFSQLADVPPETEWFANIDDPHTRRARAERRGRRHTAVAAARKT